MFGKLKSFAMKKVLEKQLKNVPEKYRAMIMEFVEKNPELCQKLAVEMKDIQSKPEAQQQAEGMKILMKHQGEIAAALTPEMKQALAEAMGNGNMMGMFNPNGTIRQ